MRLMKAEY